MNNQRTKDDILDSWVKQEITGPEAQQQLQAMEVPDIAAEMELHQVASRVLRMHGARQVVSRVHQQYMSQLPAAVEPITDVPEVNNTAARVVTMGSKLRWIAGIAASLLIMAAAYIGYEYQTASYDQIYQGMFRDYKTSVFRDAPAGDAPLVKAFSEENYAAVLEVFAETANPANREKFLAGYAALQLGKYDQAEQLFSSVLNTNKANTSRLYEDEAGYYLALTYLRLGSAEKALPLLQQIAGDKNHTYHELVAGKYLRQLHYIK